MDNKKIKKKVVKKKVSGIVTINIYSSFNNTLLSGCDSVGNVLASSSAGMMGFKGAKKSTPFAAQSAAEALSKKLKPMEAKVLRVVMNGIGSGRDAVLKVFQQQDFQIVEIREGTKIKHNGCRLPKQRKM